MFNSLNKQIKSIIKPCDTCPRCKDNNKVSIGETRPFISTRKGDLISIDYYGPLAASTGGVKYILVIVDTFTKYVKPYAVKGATTVTINKIKKYIEEYGKPSAILTENGTQFTSKR